MVLNLLLRNSGEPEQFFTTHVYEEGINITEIAGMENFINVVVDFQTPAKFHIGMLSLSLIIGLAYGGLAGYTYWMEKNTFLAYIINLVAALVCRTFFSIIFDGAILLGSPLNVGGGNTLVAFEQFFVNLVLAFWLTLTIYMHARVLRNFNSEPTLQLYQYGVPGVSVYFALVYIFVMQDQFPTLIWWAAQVPITQWTVNSINLLLLLIQLALVCDIVRMMMKTSFDNDSISLLRKVGAMLGVLVFIFWLQFGLSIGKAPVKLADSGYLYFFYLVDGLECALVCCVLYFFNKWVLLVVNKVSKLMNEFEETTTRTSKLTEVLTDPPGGGITTLNSVFMTNESKKWQSIEEEGANDVMYSTIVEPERLKKTLDLYERLNIISSNQVTVVEGDEFYDCQIGSSFVSESSEKSRTSSRPNSIRLLNKNEQMRKKNAFYSSKYLIIDKKEYDIPKYLETLPSGSSASEKASPKEELNSKSGWNPHLSDELVMKWLNDNSENMNKSDKTKEKTETSVSPETQNGNVSKEKDNEWSMIPLVSRGTEEPKNVTRMTVSDTPTFKILENELEDTIKVVEDSKKTDFSKF